MTIQIRIFFVCAYISIDYRWIINQSNIAILLNKQEI